MILAIDGMNGTGKTTIAKALANKLDAPYIQNPGYTALGKELRRILRDPFTKHTPDVDMLLFMAEECNILSAIDPYDWTTVVIDRWIASTYAYQGAKGLAGELIIHLCTHLGLDQGVKQFILLPHEPISLLGERNDAVVDRWEAEGDAFQLELDRRYRHFCTLGGIPIVVTGPEGRKPIAQIIEEIEKWV